MTSMRAIPLTLIVLLISTGSSLFGQISVAPTILFTTDQERFGTFLVNNGSATAQEVVIEFRFGYPRPDDAGQTFMEYEDDISAARFGLDSWVQAFPRRFILEPGQQQVVRMAVRPPAGVEDGTYWTRLVTTSTPQSEPVDTLVGGVSARIVMRLQHVTTLLYRVGDVDSGLVVGEIIGGTERDGSPNVTVPLRRVGNTPFLGTAEVEVRDEAGDIVATGERSVAVYFDALEAIPVDGLELPSGGYTVTVTLRPGRSDVPPEHVVGGEPLVVRSSVSWR